MLIKVDKSATFQ